MLQRVAGVKADGMIGAVTLAAVKEKTETVAEVCAERISPLERSSTRSSDAVIAFCERYIDLRDQRFRDIVAGDASQEVFLKGWLNRTSDLRDFVGLT